jgi:hypothetical protein
MAPRCYFSATIIRGATTQKTTSTFITIKTSNHPSRTSMGRQQCSGSIMDLREIGNDGGTEFCGLRIEFNGEFLNMVFDLHFP